MAALLVVVGTAFLAVGIGPHVFGYRTVTVLTGSMAPAYPAGSLVFIRSVPVEEIRVGDVITYTTPTDGRVVTHRIHAVVEPGPEPTIMTKGDAMAEPDPWLARISVPTVWKAEGGFPYAGHAVSQLRRQVLPRSGLPAAAFVFVLVAMAEIWLPRRNRRVDPTPPMPHSGSFGGHISRGELVRIGAALGLSYAFAPVVRGGRARP